MFEFISPRFPDRDMRGCIILATMLRIFESKWTRKRSIAHWILSQLLYDSIVAYANEYFVRADGTVISEQNGLKHRFEFSELDLAFLEEKRKYRSQELRDALTLLESHRYIEITSTKFMRFKATPKGVLAWQNQSYTEQIADRKAKWPRRNYIIVAILGYALGFATPILKDRLTSAGREDKKAETTTSHRQSSATAVQKYTPVSRDTVRKK